MGKSGKVLYLIKILASMKLGQNVQNGAPKWSFTSYKVLQPLRNVGSQQKEVQKD